MKKILYVLLLLFVSFSMTCSASMDFSLSGNGSAMSGNMKREGDLIYMHYNMNGLNSPTIMNNVPAEQQAAVAAIKGAEIDMVLSCSNQSIKIRSFKMTDMNGYNMETAMNDTWLPLTKPDDIQKLNELCGKL